MSHLINIIINAVSSLLEYDDVIVVASVSCIYGIGDPEDYKEKMITLREGDIVRREELLEKLVKMQYSRNDYGRRNLGSFYRCNDLLGLEVILIFPLYFPRCNYVY